MPDSRPLAPGVERPCVGCTRALFGAVAHCPYCGTAQSGFASAPKAGAEISVADRSRRTDPSAQTDAAAPPILPEQAEVTTNADAPSSLQAKPKTKTKPKPATPVVIVSTSAGSTADAPAAPIPAAKSGKKTGLWVVVGILAIAGAWIALRGGPSEQCKVSLADGERLASGDPRQARVRLDVAIQACEGNTASLERAASLSKTLQPALQALDVCDRVKKDAERQIGDGRLGQAQRLLAAQPPACAARPDLLLVRQAGEDARRNAADKLAQARSEIGEGHAEAAQALADEAEKLDRESPELARTRRVIESKVKDLASAAAAAAKAAEAAQAQAAVLAPPLQIQGEPIRPQPSFEARPTAAPTIDARRVECDVLVRGGNRALINRSYDVAMQQADEALSAFPGCPGAADLGRIARQAKDRARTGVVIQ
jgi:hypothetical protein